MAIELKNGVFLEIKVNEQEIPPSSNVFKSLTMYSGIGYEIPVAVLELNDVHAIFNTGDYALVDGTKVDIVLSQGVDRTGDSMEIKTRVLGKVKSETINTGLLRRATLVPDIPEYILEAQREFYDGTSATAITDILKKYSIEVKQPEGGLNLSDFMCWRNIGKSQIQFIKEILEHSYSGKSTCMKGCLDWNSTYFLNDLFQELKREPEVGMFNVSNVSGKENRIALRESSIDTTSGFFNKLTNYGHTHVQHSLSGDLLKFEKSEPEVFGDGLPLNEDLKNSIDLTSLTSGYYFDSGTAPLSASNMHEHYYKAQYLNMRHLSLFTETVRGICDNFNNLDLLQVCDYEHVNPEANQGEPSLNESFSGKYIIGNKIIAIRSNHYSEIYTLYRSYVTDSGSTPLSESKNTSSVSPKQTNKVDTAVDPTDPHNETTLENTVNPKVKTDTANESEQIQLAKELGEYEEPAESQANPTDSFNKFVENQKKKIDKLLNDFEEEGRAFADQRIVDKYGEAKDYLTAVGREFQSAIQKMEELCNELIPSELAALDLFGPNLGDILGMVANRINRIDQLSKEFQADVNELASKGNIPDQYLNNPRVQSTCRQLNERIQDRMSDVAMPPTNCLDRLALAKLFMPQNDLARRLQQLESLVNDLLCANGEGASANATLNGPGSTTTTVGTGT